MSFYITGMLIVSTSVHLVASAATLTLPTSANCGDPAVLTCTSSGCTSGYRFRRNNVTIYNNAGPPSGIPDPDRYSTTVRSDSQVQLTITNIQYSDVAQYACTCGFNTITTGQTLVYQCKASTSMASVTSDKKLSVTVDRLYPEPSSILTTNSTTTLQGEQMCKDSSTLRSHFMCSWKSGASFPDGVHSYTITVTTVTQAAPISGVFSIVTPMSPNISNLSTISNNRQVVRGIQDTPLTIQCVSKGGTPAPTLAWYRGNTSTSPLADSTTSASVQQSDGTYTVNLTHRFTPSRTDDLTQFLCRVFYPGATIGASPDPLPAAAFLYLDLKPSSPTVSQTGEAVSGGSMALRCTSVNGRPAPNITWSYRGQTFTPNNTFSDDLATETYTVVSVLQRPVSAEDNGQLVTCSVSHTTLSVPRNGTVVVDVKYPPTVTVSTTSSPVYTVTCTAEGFPDNYTYQDWVQIWPGYGPVNTIPFAGTTLTLTNVTYMSSGLYVCNATNGVAVYGTDMRYMQGKATIVISSRPIITEPFPDGNRILLAGRLGQNVTTEIEYWSNVEGSVVKCYKLVNGSRLASSVCFVTETITNVTLPVYEHMVQETGTLATIKIPIINETDLTDYDVIITNSNQAESVLNIHILPKGPPNAPTLKDNFIIKPGQVILTVLPGFHGGNNQTLVVQISNDLTTWVNKTYVKIPQDHNRVFQNISLDSLLGNTKHYVRVFSYNIYGISPNSEVFSFTTIEDIKSQTESPSVALIAGIVTGVCTLLVIGVVVTIICWRKKAGRKHSAGKDIGKGSTEDSISDVVECAMYGSAGQSNTDIYAKPQKPKKQTDVAGLYAVVSRPKEESIKAAHKSRTKDATVYENPEPIASSKQAKPKKNFNRDGLIYADLEFNNNPKKSVIHGLDDATTYVQVDFTKATDPLPDSDDETFEKK